MVCPPLKCRGHAQYLAFASGSSEGALGLVLGSWLRDRGGNDFTIHPVASTARHLNRGDALCCLFLQMIQGKTEQLMSILCDTYVILCRTKGSEELPAGNPVFGRRLKMLP